MIKWEACESRTMNDNVGSELLRMMNDENLLTTLNTLSPLDHKQQNNTNPRCGQENECN